MKMYCMSCGKSKEDLTTAPVQNYCVCGSPVWSSDPEFTRRFFGGYVPTEADALRAEVETLQKRLEIYGAELTQLRALRDLLIEWNKRNNRQSIDALVARDAIIARAEELAKDPWPPSP